MEDDDQYRKGPNSRINQVRLSDSLHTKLKEMANRDDRSLSYVIRQACVEYAEQDDQEQRSLRDSIERGELKPELRGSIT